jgi:hypothetical protein
MRERERAVGFIGWPRWPVGIEISWKAEGAARKWQGQFCLFVKRANHLLCLRQHERTLQKDLQEKVLIILETKTNVSEPFCFFQN